jgi:hypothetical protein
LNEDPFLDASTSLNNFIHDDENLEGFFMTNLSSKYFDLENFTAEFAKCHKPIILSFNIQSLNSKFTDLKNLVSHLLANNIPIELIILQETWQVKFSELVELPGFQPLIF